MISRLVQEEQWEEDIIKNLPVEDDRFEFKENINLDSVAKAVCAFANSFGGTLFLGIKNGTHEILGVPKKYPAGTRSNTVDWLERIVPTLLSFRFGAFRVRPVKLNPKTRRAIGKDKIIISIDVFDSDTAPYQVALKGNYEHRYFYRESSSSVLAPHSHLAYLWLRNSSDKTRVIQYLITNFLTPLISSVERIIKDFTELRFHHEPQTANGEDYIELIFKWSDWSFTIKTLAAKQFLNQEDSVGLEDSIIQLSKILKNFQDFIDEFNKTVLEQANVNINNLSDNVRLNGGGNLENFAANASRTLTYLIFDLKSIWGIPEHQYRLRQYLSEYVIKSINNQLYFKRKKREMKRMLTELISLSELLLRQAEMLRSELCVRYNTIYSDNEESSLVETFNFSGKW